MLRSRKNKHIWQKINYIFMCIGKTEEDFKVYEEAYEKLSTLEHLGK